MKNIKMKLLASPLSLSYGGLHRSFLQQVSRYWVPRPSLSALSFGGKLLDPTRKMKKTIFKPDIFKSIIYCVCVCECTQIKICMIYKILWINPKSSIWTNKELRTCLSAIGVIDEGVGGGQGEGVRPRNAIHPKSFEWTESLGRIIISIIANICSWKSRNIHWSCIQNAYTFMHENCIII